MTEMIEPMPAAIDQEQLACDLVERARAEGVELTGPASRPLADDELADQLPGKAQAEGVGVQRLPPGVARASLCGERGFNLAG